MTELSHFDERGASRMVDVGGKPATDRFARARGQIRLAPQTVQLIRDREIAKGDVLGVARLAGIMAAKRTAELIPLCHNLPLTAVEVEFDFSSDGELLIESLVRTQGPTGVEMEALMAVSIAAMTIYDMCKSVDRQMTIDRVQLVEKWGGASGHFQRSEDRSTENADLTRGRPVGSDKE
jgi:cyclic pyranopterin phosphate synthase